MTVSPIKPDTMPRTFANIEDPKPCNKIVHLASKRFRRLPILQTTQFGPQRGRDSPNGHRLLRAAELGYISPLFEGKRAQMAEGQYNIRKWNHL
jgi:hypothetical protein